MRSITTTNELKKVSIAHENSSNNHKSATTTKYSESKGMKISITSYTTLKFSEPAAELVFRLFLEMQKRKRLTAHTESSLLFGIQTNIRKVRSARRHRKYSWVLQQLKKFYLIQVCRPYNLKFPNCCNICSVFLKYLTDCCIDRNA